MLSHPIPEAKSNKHVFLGQIGISARQGVNLRFHEAEAFTKTYVNQI